jgi:plastocyanin
MHNTLLTAAKLSGLLIVGASAFASDAKQDCCSAPHGATAFMSSTPALPPVTGPAASGLVTFLGDAGGKVVLEGDAPETKPLVIEAKAAAGCVPDGNEMDKTDQSLLVSKEGGVANVVIMVTVPGAKPTVPTEPVHLDQSKCRFEPHVVVVPVGSQVAFLNSDSVNHNVHTYPKKNEAMNKTIEGGKSEVQKYDKTDQIEIKCDIHPWMNSYLIVVDTPHYAVTDASGKFSIAGLPAGTHKVDYWHEKLGKGKAEIVVKEDGTAEPLEIKLGGDKKAKPRR